MGMESHDGPRRRRVGIDQPGDNVTQNIRLTVLAAQLIQAMRQPGVLHPEGCSMGDVVAIAIAQYNPLAAQAGL
jgi:hypothetical protein